MPVLFKFLQELRSSPPVLPLVVTPSSSARLHYSSEGVPAPTLCGRYGSFLTAVEMWNSHPPYLTSRGTWCAVSRRPLMTQRVLTLTHVLLLLLLPVCHAFNYQGGSFRDGNKDVEECRTGDGGRGLCSSIFSCPAVLAAYRRVRTTFCGFKDFIPMVCCPVPVPDTERLRPTSTQPSIIAPPKIGFKCGLRGSRRTPPVRSEVVGGEETQPNSWPWIAAVGRVEPKGYITWFCEGALITPEFVLSAAHCVTESSLDLVRLGGHNLKSPAPSQMDLRVVRALLHPLYDPPSIAHDLSLLRLAKPVALTPQVSPVCLPWDEKDAPSLHSRRLTLAGWGATLQGEGMSDVLREVLVTVFSNSHCDAYYSTLHDYAIRFPGGISSHFLCAGDILGGKDACKGDSGAPLVYNMSGKYMLAGVVTAGKGCGLKNFPGIYAAVRPHLQWIKEVAFPDQE